MKCYFIDWTTNWADEMDIYSAEVLTETELKDFKKWLTKNKKKLEDGFEYGIGTNEDLDLSYEDIKETIKYAREITETEYICFKALFESSVFGDLCTESIMERVDDDYYDDEYDDEDSDDNTLGECDDE